MSRPKLLLADDSITIQKVVNLTFADQGMDVITFSDGDSAVENLDEIRPDIVLVDVNMPGINGYQICELMRSDDANKHIPVVLLVGSFEPFDREEAERVGSNGHLTKPFASIAELVSTVQSLLATSATAETAEKVEIDEGHKPDISDIESLYNQSFVETVELPRDGSLNGEFGNGIDDEMIQTSYADPDPNAEEEETYFVAESSDNFSDSADDEADLATAALIADSFPTQESSEESSFEFVPAEPEPVVNDPFESVAGDAPPVSDEDVSTSDTIRFSFDDDLLELPVSSRAAAAAASANSTLAAEPKEITSLSPELIDLIVEKVVERLANKY